MKKTLVFFLMALWVFSASAQDFQKMRLGFKAVPSLSWIKPDTKDMESKGMAFRLGYGVNGEFYFAPNYAFSTGFTVQYFGGKLSYPTKEGVILGNLDRRYYLQNLEIPLTIKMKTNEIGYMTYYGTFGIGPSFNLKARAEDDFFPVGSTSSINTKDRDVKSDIRFLRASLILGLGVEYGIAGNTSMFAGVTYNNGFTNILKGKDASDKNLQGYANWLELSVGILF